MTEISNAYILENFNEFHNIIDKSLLKVFVRNVIQKNATQKSQTFELENQTIKLLKKFNT